MSAANTEVLVFNNELIGQRDYWVERLSGLTFAPSLRPDRGGPRGGADGKSSVEIRLPEHAARGLDSLTGGSPFLTYAALLAALKVCLRRYAGGGAVVVGSPALSELGKANALAIVDEVDGALSFRQLLLNVRETLVEAYGRQGYPFHYLLNDLGLEAGDGCPLFDVALSYGEIHGALPELNNPVTITLGRAAGAFAGRIEFDGGLYERDTVLRFREHYLNVLGHALADTHARLRDIEMLSPGERARLLFEWGRAAQDFGGARPVHQLVEAHARRAPERPAVTFGDEGLTYGELDERAEQLARHLRALGVGPEAIVAVCMERSVEMVVAVLGVLKAGGAYVPLDPAYPLKRVAYMLEDSGAAVLVTQRRLADSLPSSYWGVVVCAEEWQEWEGAGAPEVPGGAAPDAANAAYVIYTSGSTGEPKGVVVEHRGLHNTIEGLIRRYYVTPESRVLQFASLSFDASVSEIFMALAAGATLHLESRLGLLPGPGLVQLLREKAITTVTLPPSVLAALPFEELEGLQTLIVAGEECGAELVGRWAPGRRFINGYGPSEATICAATGECADGSRKPPIGRPMPNTELYILDEELNPAPAGVPGEIYVGGAGVTRGYLRRPSLTAERFVPHPFSAEPGARLYRTGDRALYLPDGAVEFLGRGDRQIKLRGFRVELGEVEAALERHPGVRSAVAEVREDAPGERRLVAYVVGDDGRAPGVSELGEYLRGRLPEYMVPQAFVPLDELPLSPNGKLDRKALPAPDHARPELGEAFIAPSSEAEQLLAGIWSEVLGVEEVGVHDNFFELGGESILGIQVVARANQAGLRLTPKHLFQYQTIAQLASVAGTAPAVTAEQGLVTGAAPLTPIQRWFFGQELADQHHYNQSLMLEIRDGASAPALRRVIRRLVLHHDALRLRFVREESGWQQFHAPADDAGQPLVVIDLSELPPAERGRAVEQLADGIQASLEVTDGPLFRFALFDFGEGEPGRLLVVIHHLLVDGVSWRVLLGHLRAGYEQERLGEPIDFGDKTTSFRHWAELLAEHARSAAVESEATYWLAAPRSEVRPLPLDYAVESPAEANTAASSRRVRTSLSAEETQALLQDVPAAYGAQINETLLAALAQTLSGWTGASTHLIALEGHGREEVAEDVDLSQTVGWFTTTFPALVHAPEGADAVELLQSVKEQYRAVPGRGMGYGLLRYLGADAEVGRQLRALPEAEVSLNYLGQFDQVLPEDAPFAVAAESRGQQRSPRGREPHLLQVSGSIAGGRLQLTWAYSKNLYRRETIERLSERLGAALRAIITRSQSSDAGGYTPSDFPLAGLTQSELNQLTGAGRLIEDIYPLSPFQQGLLFHTLYSPGSGVYFTQLSGVIAQELDAGALRRAWQRVVDRHPVLRTAFVWEGLGEPVQVVYRQVALPWHEDDWRESSPEEQGRRFEAYLANDKQRGFELSEAPLMRCALVRTGAHAYRFVWSFHHLLLDGWALFRVVREVLAFYDAFSLGQGLNLPTGRPFRDYVAWLQRQDRAREEAFWRRALGGFAAPTPLGVERAARASAAQGEDFYDQRMRLSAGTTEALQALARRHQLTLNTLVQGAYALVLSRYSGEDDVVFGATVSGRPPALEGVEEMIGVFLNTLPVRVRVSPQRPLVSWLKEIQEQQVEAREFEHTPLVQAQAWSDVPRGRPLFESILIFENFPVDDSLRQRGGKLHISDVRSVDRANYPLAVGVSPGRELLFRFSYDRGRLEDEAVARMFGHLRVLLEAFAADPGQRLADLPMLTEEERRQVAEWNATGKDYGPARPVHRLFEEQARRAPDRPAVTSGEECLTYAELDERADQLARQLRALGVGPEALVAVCVERSAEMVVALLGVLKAGGAYVPLDPSYPLERIAYMLEDSGAAVLVTQRRLADSLPSSYWGPVVCVDEEPWDGPAQEASGVEATADNAAYVIYTSGSTGEPKGVVVEHRGLFNTLRWRAEALSLGAADRILQTTSFSFDASVWEFFAPLVMGAQLVMLRPGGHQDPAYLVEMIARHRVTALQLPPLWLPAVLEQPGFASCDSVRHVICGGEAMTPALQRRFFERLPAADLHNLYGPSEASIDATAWKCRRDADAVIPIGGPIANARVHILDRSLRPVPVGLPGELYLSGAGLARGYLNRPALTAEKFVPDPFSGEAGERLYRTGDLARYLPDGNVEFLGRLDEQVKVRGFRIELGEIEAALGQHGAVRDAVVLAREDALGDKRLVAYVAAQEGSALTVNDLRAFLKERLPEHMTPSFFVMLEALPLTANGKVDRAALPAPDHSRPDLEEAYAAPCTPAEEALAAVWSEVLGVERVGIDDNFFALGGDSIRSVQVLAKAQERGLSLTLQELFEHQTVRVLAAQLGGATPAATAEPMATQSFGLVAAADRALVGDDVEDAYPLTMLQAGMIFHTEYHPDSAIYHSVSSRRIRARLDVSALRDAVQHIVAQHPVLRTSFHLTGFGEPLQLVHREVRVPVSEDDLRHLEPAEQGRAVESWLEEEKVRRFDWARPPLFRIHLHRFDEETFQFTFTSHHAIFDGWSDSLFFAELFKRYVAALGGRPAQDGPPPATSYRDFVWLERQALASEETRKYWGQKMSGRGNTRLARRASRGSARAGYEIRRLPIPVPPEVSEGLKRLAQLTGVPVKDVLLAAHLKVMSLLGGGDDVLTGLVSNGRPEVADGERVIGLFLNTLPLRVGLKGGTWADLVRQTFEAEKELLPHRRYPLMQIQTEQGGQPLFETAFNFTHFYLYDELKEFEEVKVLDSVSVAETNFTLMVNFSLGINTNQVQAIVDCNAGELDEKQIDAIPGYYANALERMAAEPLARHDARSLLGEAERRRLLVEWNDTAADYPADEAVHHLFEAQAARTPRAVAVVSGDERLTYAELDERADRLARRLRSLGVGPEVLVAVLMERSAGMVVALLGVLKAGGAYVPLDPSYPSERVAYMLGDSGAKVLLTEESLRGLVPAGGARVLCLDDAAGADAWGAGGAAVAVSPADLAYVIYTSGSTGRPKGVMVTHGALSNHMRWMAGRFPLSPEDAVLQKTPLGFDASVWEFWAPLLAGARLVLARPDGHRDPRYLAEAVASEGVTVLQVVPSLLRALLEEPGFAECRGLRRVFCGGEELTGEAAARFAGLLPAAGLVNLYGPTEATIDASYCEYDEEEAGGPVPIGRPVANTRLYVLDKHMSPAPAGAAGELYVGGAQLARGYLGRPALTAERFVPDPFSIEPGARLYRTGDLARHLADGRIEYLGRIDQQVKVRGHRIELGEVEAALRGHEAVSDAAVAADGEGADKRLVAYVVGRVGAAPDGAALREHLRGRLPEYMIPSAFVPLDELPLTPNGKLDRGRLPQPAEWTGDVGAAADGPRTPVEEVVAGIWAQVLRVGQIGVEADFFELGGHSLFATQVISRVREVFRVEVPLRTLFEAPTLASFAARIRAAVQAQQGLSAPPIKRVPRDAELPLSFAQQRLWIAQRLVGESPVFNLPAAVRLTGRLDAGALERSLSELVARHEVLRTTYTSAGGRLAQVIDPPSPLPLPLIDLSDLPGAERESEARRLAAEEAVQPFDLSRGPMLRARLLRLGADEHVLLFTMHHIASDGWSMAVLIDDLVALYEAFAAGRPSPLAALPLQYADFAHWQREWLRGDVLESQLKYWRERLGDGPAELLLPADRPRPPVQTHRGAYQSFLLPSEPSEGLNALSRREGVTLFMTLLAAFQTLLYRYSSQEDIVVGTDLANRNRAETESIVGFFVNMVVLRTDLSGAPSFRELLGRVREVTLGAYAHQDLPFEVLVEELQPERDLGRNPIFQAVFVLQNTPTGDVRLPGLTLQPLRVEGRTVQFDLILSMSQAGDALAGTVAYSTDLFDDATVEELIGRFQTLLQSIVEDPDLPVNELRLLREAETNGLAPADFPKAGLSQKEFESLFLQLGGGPSAVGEEQ